MLYRSEFFLRGREQSWRWLWSFMCIKFHFNWCSWLRDRREWDPPVKWGW